MTRIEKEQARVSSVSLTLKSSQDKYRLLISTLVLVTLLVVNPVWAEDVKYREVETLELQEAFGTKQPWKVTAYQDVNAMDDDNTGESLKLCFWHNAKKKQDQCHLMKNGPRKFTWVHSISIKTIAQLNPATLGIELISKRAYPSIHGRILNATIWTYNPDKNVFANILRPAESDYGVSYHGIVTDYKLLPDVEGQGIVVATRLSGEKNDNDGKMYWSQRYKLIIYRYHNNRYQHLGDYMTSKKYDMQEPWVIEQESENIKRFVREQMQSKTH